MFLPSRSTRYSHHLFFIACGVLMVFFFFILLYSASQENQIIDEGVHLASGVSYLRLSDFRLNPEHPSLFKTLAALPVLFLRPRLPIEDPSWRNGEQWRFADLFLYANVRPADELLFWGRLPTMVLSLLTLLLLLIWGRQLFGDRIALLLGVFFVFDPTIVAHSRYVTSDLGVCLGFLWSVFNFIRWLKKGGRKWGGLTILSVLFALLMKFSAVLLLPILILIWISFLWHQHRYQTLQLKYEMRRMGNLAIWGLLWIVFGIWAAYQFQLDPLSVVYADRPEDAPSRLLNIPLPALSYVRGLITVIGHSSGGHVSYLLGEESIKGGWWYYFPVAFFVKATPAMLIFLVLAMVAGIKRMTLKFRTSPFLSNRSSAMPSNARLDLVAILIMIVVYSGGALTSNLNIGVRHLLPIFPFLFLLFGFLFKLQFQPSVLQRYWQPLLISILGFSALSTALIYPNVLTYFNPFVGGPASGGVYLVDSNLDWGQDLKKLKKFLDANGIREVAMQYFGKGRVSYYGITETPLPTDLDLAQGEVMPAHAAISATVLFSERDQYRWLFDQKPTARIGNSIYYYDLSSK